MAASDARLESLLAQFSHPDRTQRHQAAQAAGALGPAAVPALGRLLREGRLLERPTAARALGHTHSRGALPPLVHALKDRELEVRLQATVALGRLGFARAYPALVWVLRHRRGEEQRAAVEALGLIGDRRAVPVLSPLLRGTTLTGTAALALARLGERAVVGEVAAALRLFTHTGGDPDHAGACIRALGTLGGPESVRALCRLGAARPDLRLGAEEALMEIGEAGIAALAEALCHADTAQLAAVSLGRLGAAAVPPLCTLVLTADHATRLRALAVLDTLRDPRAVPTLLEILADSSPAIRAQAVRILGLLNVTAVVPRLLDMLEDPDAVVRRRAAVSLAALGDFGLERVPLLTDALEDLDEGVRTVAARALTWLAKLHRSHLLRQALPVLRRVSQPWRPGSLDARDAFNAAIEAIEAATDDRRALPLAAAPGAPDGASLPRPAGTPEPDAAALPRIPEG